MTRRWRYWTGLRRWKRRYRKGCTQPHEEFCRFTAAADAILRADSIGREYN
jgi:hypothetical protein